MLPFQRHFARSLFSGFEDIKILWGKTWKSSYFLYYFKNVMLDWLCWIVTYMNAQEGWLNFSVHLLAYPIQES